MTLTSVLTKLSFSGNGSTTVFAVSFVYYDDDGLRVILVDDTTGVETVQTITTGYTLSGGGGATGTLTMIVAPASGETLIIKSDIDDTQETDFPTGGNLRSTSIEEQMDILTRLVQQKEEQISRVMILKESTTLANLAFPDPVSLGFIRWNTAATALETTTGISGGAFIEDADADTKIQVEESSDEDIIRFDVAGTQIASMTASAIAFGLPVSITGALTVSSTVDGRDIAADGTVLDAIEAGATGDQTGAEIKTLYEAESSAFTDTQFTKLAGIETSADVTDYTNVAAALAAPSANLIFNEASGDFDVRFEGLSNTHLLFLDGGNNRVGISSTSLAPTDGLLHIQTASAGTVTAHVWGDELILEGSTGPVGMSILGNDGTHGMIIFGDASNNKMCTIDFNHSGNILEFEVGASTDIHLTCQDAVGVIINEGGVATLDFRVESDTSTHAIFVDAGNDRVGISNVSLTPTEGLLHIQSGTAGTVTANVASDELVVEGAFSAGISVLTPLTAIGSIVFGSPANSRWGGIHVDHTAGTLDIRAASNVVFATLTAGSVKQFTLNDVGNDFDFRVEGDTSQYLFFTDGSAERVGISSTSLVPTDGLLHIQSGTAGTVTANAGSDELVVESVAAGGISLLGPEANEQSIYWGNVTANNRARFSYSGTSNIFLHYHNEVEIFRTSTAGIIFNETGAAAVDFRVESDTSTHALFVDAGNNRVGISSASLTPTDGLLHIQSATAGGITASTAADELVVEGTGNMGMNFLAGATDITTIGFGNPTDGNLAGTIQYAHASSTLEMSTVAGEQWRCSAAGSVFNEGGVAAIDFRVEGNTSTHTLFVNAGNNQVGISNASLASTDGLLHIQSATAGVVSASTVANELVIEGTGNVGLSILTNTTGQNILYFGSPTSNSAGQIFYTISSNTLQFWTNNLPQLKLDDGTGFIYNENGIATNDFRVESDTSTHALFVDAGNNRVGISSASLTPTDGLLHIQSGTAGAVTASTNADELVLESATNAGITILAGNAASSIIYFGDDGNNAIGQFLYQHVDDSFAWATNGANQMVLRASGNLILGPSFPDPTSAAGNLVLGIDSSPTATTAGVITIGAKDASAGTTDATLELWLETAPVVIGTFTASHKFPIWINGTEYHIQLDAV